MPSSSTVRVVGPREGEIAKCAEVLTEVFGVERVVTVLERVLLKADLKNLDRDAYEKVLADLRERAAEWRKQQ